MQEKWYWWEERGRVRKEVFSKAGIETKCTAHTWKERHILEESDDSYSVLVIKMIASLAGDKSGSQCGPLDSWPVSRFITGDGTCLTSLDSAHKVAPKNRQHRISLSDIVLVKFSKLWLVLLHRQCVHWPYMYCEWQNAFLAKKTSDPIPMFEGTLTIVRHANAIVNESYTIRWHCTE